VGVVGRVAPRVPVDAPVAFWRDGNPAEGRLINLSSTGFLTATSDPQPVGARLEIRFKVPHGRSGKIVTGEAIVVRRTGGARSGFGARFFRLSESARRLVDDYLAACLKRGRGPA